VLLVLLLRRGASSAATELQVRVPDSQVAVLDAMQQRAEAARAGGVRE
jgi:hypothetical protein